MDLLYRWLWEALSNLLYYTRLSLSAAINRPRVTKSASSDQSIISKENSSDSSISSEVRNTAEEETSRIDSISKGTRSRSSISRESEPELSINTPPPSQTLFEDLKEYTSFDINGHVKRRNRSSTESLPSSVDINFTSSTPKPSPISSTGEIEATTNMRQNACSILPTPSEKQSTKTRRCRVPDRPNIGISYWSIFKDFIGQELAKIPLPVNLNEPLSMLQRLTEEFEYAELLDQASQCEDLLEQIAYIAAFTISSYSTTDRRFSKPFNPLLGETFEFDRTEDLGWRSICEQVSHHPPISSLYCEGKNWKSLNEFAAVAKFTGNSLHLKPLGTSSVEFQKTGRKYTWRKVDTAVRNIMIGKLYLEHYGGMDILGEDAAEGVKCHLKFLTEIKNVKDSNRKVIGEIYNAEEEVKWILVGYWDKYIKIARVKDPNAIDEDDFESNVDGYKIIWTRRMPEPDSPKYYNFTIFASQLNEPEEGVAPTDSRNRPDQRNFEDGRWKEANEFKKILEEKQRERQKLRVAAEKEAQETGTPFYPYEPAWFKWNEEEKLYVYGEEYWECKLKQDWSRCPDIF